MGHDHKCNIVTATQKNTAFLERWIEQLYDIDWRCSQILSCIDKPEYQLRLAVSASGDKNFISDTNPVTGLLLSHFVDKDCTLMLIAVAPSFRRQGVGQLLTQDLIEQAHNRGCENIYLEARESNSAAISLYKNVGFRHQGTRKNYYPARFDHGSKESAVLLQLNLRS